MRAHHPLLLLLALYASSVFVGAAYAKDCGVSDEQFLKQLSKMKDWQSIYSVFKINLPACPDDGFYAEGYSDVVVVALSKRWSDLGTLQALMARDAEFREFVYKHIDATTDEKDLGRVLRNARTRCPIKAKRLCEEIAVRAKRAIAELK